MKNLIWKKTLEINLVKLIKTVILCIDRFLKEIPKSLLHTSNRGHTAGLSVLSIGYILEI